MNLLFALAVAFLPISALAATPDPDEFLLRPDKTVNGLASSDVKVRRAAIHQFVNSLDTKYVKEYDNSLLPVLLMSAKDPDPEVRYYGLSAARLLAHAVILSRGSKDHVIFGRAVSIDFAKEPKLLPIFRKIATDSDPRIRTCAVSALGKAYPPSDESEKFLTDIAKTETNANVRREIVDGLGAGQYRSAATVKTLVRMLDDQSEQVKGWSGFFLGRSKAKEALPSLVAKLDDERPFVREKLVQAVSAFGADSRPYLPDLKKHLGAAKDDQARKALRSAIENIEGSTSAK